MGFNGTQNNVESMVALILLPQAVLYEMHAQVDHGEGFRERLGGADVEDLCTQVPAAEFFVIHRRDIDREIDGRFGWWA